MEALRDTISAPALARGARTGTYTCLQAAGASLSLHARSVRAHCLGRQEGTRSNSMTLLRITTHPSSLFLFTPQPTQSPPHPLLAPCQRLAQETFAGVLSSNERINPLFHNWNLVRLLYCDGGGYAGTRGRINRTDSYSHPSTAGTSPKSVRIAPGTNVVLHKGSLFKAHLSSAGAEIDIAASSGQPYLLLWYPHPPP
ncbi:unnamed protein product [Closterium sp. NIES-65]|nr:unnamed protein product [Closterium sp. NIES-65]